MSAVFIKATFPPPLQAYVTDCKSKFGTFIGGVKLQWNSKEELGQNAVVKFGQMGAEYRCLVASSRRREGWEGQV